jgi:hypothetical protein
VGVALALLAGALAGCARSRPRVVLYGDSLSWEAAGGFQLELSRVPRAKARASAVPGAAPCDLIPLVEKDLADPPDVAVLQFSGNNTTSCMRGPDGRPLTGDALLERYAADAETVTRLLVDAGTAVVWAGSPVARFSDQPAALNERYRALAEAAAARGEPVRYAPADRAVLAPDGTYTDTLPCLPFEGPDRGCVDGRIAVRAPDGVHFCPAGGGGSVPCPVWSSGAFRFGTAMADAAQELLGEKVGSALSTIRSTA